jgi:hypothetical protein
MVDVGPRKKAVASSVNHLVVVLSEGSGFARCNRNQESNFSSATNPGTWAANSGCRYFAPGSGVGNPP